MLVRNLPQAEIAYHDDYNKSFFKLETISANRLQSSVTQTNIHFMATFFETHSGLKLTLVRNAKRRQRVDMHNMI